MSIDSATPFDAAQEVPDEYDIFCEACGYSLVGLSGDRCPECGALFHPNDLPFARIPWLHRRRLGKVNAYIRTVAMVCFIPARFAHELCRPVRISAADARSFRLTTIWLLTALFALIVTGLWIAAILPAVLRGHPPPLLTTVFYTFASIAGIAAFHLFLRLATDMPLYIWKGLPSMKSIELSPVHQYASAPLVLFPLMMALTISLVYLSENAYPITRNATMHWALATALFGPLWLWLVALVLMHASTRPGRRRLALLAIYLPFHWLIMLSLSAMLWFAFVECEHVVAGLLHVVHHHLQLVMK